MEELNLPTLALFNRTQTITKRSSLPKEGRIKPYLHSQLQQPNYIMKKHYVPERSYAPNFEEQYEKKNLKNLIEIDYLNTFTRTLNGQMLYSGSNTNHDFCNQNLGINTTNENHHKIKCECEDPHFRINVPERKIIKNVYINSKNPPIYIEQQKQNPNNITPNKFAYLSKNNGNQIVHPIKDIIIRPERYVNPNDVNKSLLISSGTQKKQQTPQHKQIQQQYQQTDQIDNGSFFIKKKELEHGSQNQEFFRKKLNYLNEQLNNIQLNQSSEDIVVDLSGLIKAKNMYIEESQNNLSHLNALAEGKIKRATITKYTMCWPSEI